MPDHLLGSAPRVSLCGMRAGLPRSVAREECVRRHGMYVRLSVKTKSCVHAVVVLWQDNRRNPDPDPHPDPDHNPPPSPNAPAGASQALPAVPRILTNRFAAFAEAEVAVMVSIHSNTSIHDEPIEIHVHVHVHGHVPRRFLAPSICSLFGSLALRISLCLIGSTACRSSALSQPAGPPRLSSASPPSPFPSLFWMPLHSAGMFPLPHLAANPQQI
jgi:hypothetical protein